MNKITFYEQVGIVIPGAVLLFGLVLWFPPLYAVIAKDGVTLGQFGIFFLLAYAAGHLIAAIGNGIEHWLWKLAGGMPSDWVTRTSGERLLSEAQIENLAGKVRTRLGLMPEKIPGMAGKAWWPISRQIYADVAKNGKPDRIDTFNGNYGLNRGLAASCLVLACISLVHKNWLIGIAFLFAAAVYAYRAYRFGVYYGRELYLQFLVLDKEIAKPAS